MNEEQKILIRSIGGTEEEMTQVSYLYKELNDYQVRLGMSIKLVEGGEVMWAEAFRKVLGKYSQIIIAETEYRIVGFSAGVLKVLPPYYGSTLLGFWDSMYIQPEYRKLGLGDQMTKMLVEWWTKKGVAVIEGERLVVNENAMGNYKRLGFHPEIVKYRMIVTR